MTESVQRYTWCDALVEAQALGIITNGSLMVGMKLAHAITWSPKSGGRSELRWANDLAFEVVGLARSTYYQWAPQLREAGFITEIGGNIVPLIPDTYIETQAAFVVRREELKAKYEAMKAKKEQPKSVGRTVKSVGHTYESVVRTPESVGHNPYSVDTYPVDKYSVDSLSVEKTSNNLEEEAGTFTSLNNKLHTALPNIKDTDPLNDSGRGTAKSVVRTENVHQPKYQVETDATAPTDTPSVAGVIKGDVLAVWAKWCASAHDLDEEVRNAVRDTALDATFKPQELNPQRRVNAAVLKAIPVGDDW